jgi:hypothetical protein
MADEQNRLAPSLAVVAHDQVALGRVLGRCNQSHIGPGEPTGEQAITDGFGGLGRSVDVFRIDLDQLFQDRPRKLSIGFRRQRPGRGGPATRSQ